METVPTDEEEKKVIHTFHCCATCTNFVAEKNERGMSYRCRRLGFETKSTYKFDCWDPTERVKKLILLRKQRSITSEREGEKRE